MWPCPIYLTFISLIFLKYTKILSTMVTTVRIILHFVHYMKRKIQFQYKDLCPLVNIVWSYISKITEVELHEIIDMYCKYRHTSFYCASFSNALWILYILHIEGLWQPCAEQVYWCHFSNSICSLRICVIFSQYSINIIFVLVTCDQWSLMLLLQLSEGSDDG